MSAVSHCTLNPNAVTHSRSYSFLNLNAVTHSRRHSLLNPNAVTDSRRSPFVFAAGYLGFGYCMLVIGWRHDYDHVRIPECPSNTHTHTPPRPPDPYPYPPTPPPHTCRLQAGYMIIGLGMSSPATAVNFTTLRLSLAMNVGPLFSQQVGVAVTVAWPTSQLHDRCSCGCSMAVVLALITAGPLLSRQVGGAAAVVVTLCGCGCRMVAIA